MHPVLFPRPTPSIAGNVLKGEFHSATGPLYVPPVPRAPSKKLLARASAKTALQGPTRRSRTPSSASVVTQEPTRIERAKRSAWPAPRGSSMTMTPLPAANPAARAHTPPPMAPLRVWHAALGNISTRLRERDAISVMWDSHKTNKGVLGALHVIMAHTATSKEWPTASLATQGTTRTTRRPRAATSARLAAIPTPSSPSPARTAKPAPSNLATDNRRAFCARLVYISHWTLQLLVCLVLLETLQQREVPRAARFAVLRRTVSTGPACALPALSIRFSQTRGSPLAPSALLAARPTNASQSASARQGTILGRRPAATCDARHARRDPDTAISSAKPLKRSPRSRAFGGRA